jgi:hypothetical protein
VSLTIEAAQPRTSATPVAPSESLSGADFAAALRDFTDQDDSVLKRFARLNACLRTDRPAYPDRADCRSWLVW